MAIILRVSISGMTQDGDNSSIEHLFEVFEQDTNRFFIEPSPKKGVKKTELDRIVRSINDAIASANADFKNLGSVLRELLLPDEVNKFLHKHNTPLLIRETYDSKLPWEAIYIDEFLGIKAPISRITTERRISCNGQKWPPSFLFIMNPTEDLEKSEVERISLSQEIKNLLPEAGIEFILGNAAEKARIQQELSSGKYDVIHYSGHADIDEEGGQGFLRLANNERLTSREAKDFLEASLRYHPENRRHPFVFINGCISAVHSTETAHASIANRIESIAAGFIDGGARAVIGTHCEIPDDVALEFAKKFYQLFLTANPIGEAVRKAREAVKKSRSDGAWLSFILYGDPYLSLTKPDETFLELFLPDGNLNKDRFSFIAWLIMETCLKVTKDTNWTVITTLHLLMALTFVEKGCTQAILTEHKFDTAIIRLMFKIVLPEKHLSKCTNIALKREYFNKNLIKTLSLANEYAIQKNHKVIEEGHLFYALLQNDKGIIVRIFTMLGIDVDDVRKSEQWNTLEDATTITICSHDDPPVSINPLLYDTFSSIGRLIKAEKPENA